MNIQTLLKLRRNPHYRFTPAQKQQLAEYDRLNERKEERMVEFGVPPTHNTVIPTHPVLKKRGRSKK